MPAAAGGGWVLAWDGENRLIEAVKEADTRLVFAYDYQSRRVRKVTYAWQDGDWVQATDQKFLYDGWNPVVELASGGDLPATTVRTWGLDLSGTLQGAGGVGGLLATHLSGQVNVFVYDGNGNVSEALRVSDGNIEAHYEYDPFGGTTASNGAWASANPYRFSTKYFDGESALYYYGYRYYSARMGRWVSRDPFGEEYLGSVGVYVLLGNLPTLTTDYLGLFGAGDKAFKGHGNFCNLGKCPFDYNLEDTDPNTSAWPVSPGAKGHFLALGDSESAVEEAVAACNADAFQRAAHRGQDYFTHYGKGYVWDPGNLLAQCKGYGHGCDGGGPDQDNKAWGYAEKLTQKWVAKWKTSCCIRLCKCSDMPCGECGAWTKREPGLCDPAFDQ